MFGQYLIAQGIVDEKSVYDALNCQKARKQPIGKIALQEKMLTVKQVFAILNIKAEKLNNKSEKPKLFGEIAIELGYLDARSVDDLLSIQRKSVTPIGEILIEMGKIDHPTLETMLKRYNQSHQE